MANKTAMQQYVDFLKDKNILDSISHSVISKCLPQFLEIEKKQIIDAMELGLKTTPSLDKDVTYSGNNYYRNMYEDDNDGDENRCINCGEDISMSQYLRTEGYCSDCL